LAISLITSVRLPVIMQEFDSHLRNDMNIYNRNSNIKIFNIH